MSMWKTLFGLGGMQGMIDVNIPVHTVHISSFSLIVDQKLYMYMESENNGALGGGASGLFALGSP